MPKLMLDRATLAKLLQGNHQAIVAFEKVLGAVGGEMPSAIEEAHALAASALAVAQVNTALLALLADTLDRLETAPAQEPMADVEDHAPRAHLGTISSQNADQVEITGGGIDGTPVGQAKPEKASFTQVNIGKPIAIPTASLTTKQVAGGDGAVLQRASDSSPSGHLLRLVDAANSQNLVLFDALGNLELVTGAIDAGGGFSTPSSFEGKNVVIRGAGEAVPEGQVCIGANLASTASAGNAVLPPAPATFLTVFYGSTVYKIPMYSE